MSRKELTKTFMKKMKKNNIRYADFLPCMLTLSDLDLYKHGYLLTPQSHKGYLTLKALNICSYKPWRPKGFMQFEIIINVLVSSF